MSRCAGVFHSKHLQAIRGYLTDELGLTVLGSEGFRGGYVRISTPEVAAFYFDRSYIEPHQLANAKEWNGNPDRVLVFKPGDYSPQALAEASNHLLALHSIDEAGRVRFVSRHLELQTVKTSPDDGAHLQNWGSGPRFGEPLAAASGTSRVEPAEPRRVPALSVSSGGAGPRFEKQLPAAEAEEAKPRRTTAPAAIRFDDEILTPKERKTFWWRRVIESSALLLMLMHFVGVATAQAEVIVTNVVDGDTLDVTIDGEETRVRLLNVDTPESVDPNGEVECLGPEAAEYLRTLLPVGTEVRLEYDRERTDPYGRTLAAVYKDDLLVNSAIAEQGLGVAVQFDGNDRFYEEVLMAQIGARGTSRGLFSTDIDCTIPAQVEALQELTELAPIVEQDLEAQNAQLTETLGLLVTARALSEGINGDEALLGAVAHRTDSELQAVLRSTISGLAHRETSIREGILVEEERLEQERLEQERLEQERLERERQEQERLERERIEQERLEQERRAAQQQESSSSGRSSSTGLSSSGSSSSSGGGYDGYTSNDQNLWMVLGEVT